MRWLKWHWYCKKRSESCEHARICSSSPDCLISCSWTWGNCQISWIPSWSEYPHLRCTAQVRSCLPHSHQGNVVLHHALSEDCRWPEIINVLPCPVRKWSSTELSSVGIFSWRRGLVGDFFFFLFHNAHVWYKNSSLGGGFWCLFSVGELKADCSCVIVLALLSLHVSLNPLRSYFLRSSMDNGSWWRWTILSFCVWLLFWATQSAWSAV